MEQERCIYCEQTKDQHDNDICFEVRKALQQRLARAGRER